MKCNIGKTDRLLRIALGLLVLALGAAFDSYWGLVGLVPLATGICRSCPLYSLFHIDTGCKP